ncbi:hypothetical protein [Sorangium sp. So ce204]|uniref:hypothetical protein n=1 Tax=Sorangium sp. So ce204 TaxID=3133288 RepID=UPI003F5EC317
MTNRETRRVLTEEDLSYLVERLRIFDAHAGARPYSRAELWGSVMELYLTAKTRADRETFAELVGALRVLDALERHFLRRE